MKRIFRILLMISVTLSLLLTGCSSNKAKDSTEAVTQDKEDASAAISPAVTSEASSAAEISPAVTAAVSPAPEETGLTEKEFTPSEENVKLLGRTYLLGDTLWLSLSASGIEFTFTGTKAELTLKGDNIAFPALGEGHFCRIGVYVNDELVSDELLKDQEKTITAFESDTEETVTIKVLKLTEAADSTVGIGKIKVVTKDSIKPTSAKSHRIEFIGDSITCGFGVDDDDPNGAYTTATEDASKTFAYKTAQALDADYSMMAMSGYGIISGYTPSAKNPGQIIPAYYDKMGSSYGLFNGNIKVDSISWDFSRFVPDLIVINLGTNDYSYTKSDSAKMEEFATGYVDFLKQVREKNPDAAILCTLGMMGDNLYPSIEEAVGKYTEETGDSNVYSMRFDVQQQSDGIGACWHPSEKTHTKAAEKLTAKIKEILGW